MPQHDIYQEVTNKIIELLEQVHPDDYQPPFAGLAAQGLPLNPTTENHYQGINILCLWFNQQSKTFTSNHWATYKQWKDAGSHVRKGEKGSRIIFYKTLTAEEETTKGTATPNKKATSNANCSKTTVTKMVEQPKPEKAKEQTPEQRTKERLDRMTALQALQADIQQLEETKRDFDSIRNYSEVEIAI